jgi:HEAT repeat protein
LAAKIAAKPAKAAKLLAKALKDGDRRYRFAAFGMASPYTDGAMYGALVKSLAKAAPEVKADILNWLSQEADIPGRRETITPLAGPAAIGLLSTGDADLTKAAAGVLTKTGGAQAITALAAMLGSPDAQIVATAAAALASTKGDIASAVAPLVATAGETGKISTKPFTKTL